MRDAGRLHLVFIVLLSTAVRVQAQDTPTTPEADAPPVVVVSEKSPVAAGVLEWVLPTLGYGYAGNWTRGIPPALVRITGATLVLSQYGLPGFGEPQPCEGECVVGVVMAVGATIWAIVDAGRTASRENARRRDTIFGSAAMPTLGPTGRGIGLRISVGF